MTHEIETLTEAYNAAQASQSKVYDLIFAKVKDVVNGWLARVAPGTKTIERKGAYQEIDYLTVAFHDDGRDYEYTLHIGDKYYKDEFVKINHSTWGSFGKHSPSLVKYFTYLGHMAEFLDEVEAELKMLDWTSLEYANAQLHHAEIALASARVKEDKAEDAARLAKMVVGAKLTRISQHYEWHLKKNVKKVITMTIDKVTPKFVSGKDEFGNPFKFRKGDVLCDIRNNGWKIVSK